MNRSSGLLRWLVVLAITAVGGFLSFGITINDDALDLLPGEAVQGDLQLLQRLGLVDRVIITLSVEPDSGISDTQAVSLLQKSAEHLGLILDQSQVFSHVVSRLPQGFELELFKTVKPHLPALLDQKDLAILDASMTSTGIHAALRDDFAMLNSPAGFAAKKQVQQDPLGIIRLVLKKLEHLRVEFSKRRVDGFLMSSDGRSCLLMAESRLPLTDGNNAQTVQDVLERAYKESLAPGVQARVIGSLPHTLANSHSIKHDLRTLLPVASILLLTLLGATLRDIRALVVLSVPFMAAPLAISVTNFIFGKVSALALGFGIVLLGIAVDFSIHLYLALTRERDTRVEILRRIRRPITFAALTTASVFVVLLFSQVPSHKQMAMLALIGVLLAVTFSWLVIPTIAVPRQNREKNSCGFKVPALSSSPLLQSIALAVWVCLLAGGLLTWPNLHYNGDLRVLDAPNPEVLSAEQHFRETWGQNDEQAFVVASGKTLAIALDRNSLIYDTLIENNVAAFQSIAPILPGFEKQQENMEGWIQFWKENRPHFDTEFKNTAIQYGFAENGFDPFFKWLEHEPALLEPDKMLSGPLQALLTTMIRTPLQQKMGNQSDSSGEFLIMTTVATDKELLSTLLSLEESETGITVLANKKWRAQVERLLRKDIINLSFAAGCIITFLVVFAYKRARAVVGVLAPVASALSAMSLFCFFSNGELNMMHVLMGIMVIGLSVDYGIFVVCSKLEGLSGTSFFAVSICAASSLIGFGVLAFAQHPALHSLGVTVLVGIGAAWPTAILVSPAILRKVQKVAV
ncbi:MAG: MMPL family transporter [Desulfobulbaceae bacterium]|nr:MMPL family transporter [Desulfobulbaceae bacterium]